MVAHNNSDSNTKKEDFPFATFTRFLDKIHLKGMLEKLPDLRDPRKIIYPNRSLLLYALSIFFFRQGSKNAFHTSLEAILPCKRKGILKYLDIKSEKFPHQSVVDDYLATLDLEQINHLLIALFRQISKNKLFYNHAGSLLSDGRLHLACDGFWVHEYSHPHATDENGKNICPYCLPKVRNKGTENEKTYWVHAFVNFVLLFPGGLQLPIYVYPLKATRSAPSSEERLKQECELQAFHEVLPKLSKDLGRIPITLLIDSLYANEPVIQRCDQLKINYVTVRKEGSLKSIGRVCDELAQTEIYQKKYRANRRCSLENGKVSEQKAEWFNRVAVSSETYTNVLRFTEVIYDKDGNSSKKFTTEWLTKERVHKDNCFLIAQEGRMRADHEDLHNSLKTRGFNAEHDYARNNPNLWVVWAMLMFVAFFVFELFSATRQAQTDRKNRSWKKFARDLFQEFINIPWEQVVLSGMLQRKIQFRYQFLPG